MNPVLQILWTERAGRMQWHLARDGLLVLRDARGWQLACAAGRLWLSESEGSEEILLPGTVYRIAHQGDTVISAHPEAWLSAWAPPERRLLERLCPFCSIPLPRWRYA